MKVQHPTLVQVVGPTAIGKTRMAIALAQAWGCDIVSTDSRQFYRDMRIGTAVPEPEELAAAPHHCIQHISIHQPYSVGDYVREAEALLDHLFVQNNIQVAVGGSGLYAQALSEGLNAFPDIDPEVRLRLQQGYAVEGLPYLQALLAEHDPHFYQHLLHTNPQSLQNPQRLMRYVEVGVGAPQPYSFYLQQKPAPKSFQTLWLGLEAPKAVLNARIDARVMQMMAQGLLDEAKALYAHRANNALQTVGYTELFAHLDGQHSLEEAVALIQLHTRQFAKRQMTWFKKRKDILWIPYDTAVEEALDQLNTKVAMDVDDF